MSADLTRLDVTALQAALAAGETSAVEVTQRPPGRHRGHRRRAELLPARRHRGRAGHRRRGRPPSRRRRGARPLAGVPVALKDVVVTDGVPTTSGSRILEGWLPPYDATVAARLKAAGTVLLGKTNMDEFAMGSSTENSAYGPTRNPWDHDRIPWLLRRVLGRRRRVPRAVGHRHRHRRLHPPARRRHRPGRAQAHLRLGVPLRPHRLLLQPRPGRPDGAHRRRRRPHARGHRRARPARLHLHRRTGRPLRGRAQQVAQGDLTGTVVGVVRELGGEGHTGYEPASPRVLRGVPGRGRPAARAGRRGPRGVLPQLRPGAGRLLPIAPIASEASSNLSRFRRRPVRPAGRRRRQPRPRRGHGADPRAGLRPRGEAPHHPRHLRAVGRLLRGLLRPGAEGPHADRARLPHRLRRRRRRAGQPDVAERGLPPRQRVDDPLAMYAADLCTLLPASLAGLPAISVPCGLSEGLPVGCR